jgi:hypothetical protein
MTRFPKRALIVVINYIAMHRWIEAEPGIAALCPACIYAGALASINHQVHDSPLSVVRIGVRSWPMLVTRERKLSLSICSRLQTSWHGYQ